MDFKSLDGTRLVSRVSFPPMAKATGFPSSREVFMIKSSWGIPISIYLQFVSSHLGS